MRHSQGLRYLKHPVFRQASCKSERRIHWILAVSSNDPVAKPRVLVAKPIESMYGIYANIGGILMVNVTIYIYIAYMDPMGNH